MPVIVGEGIKPGHPFYGARIILGQKPPKGWKKPSKKSYDPDNAETGTNSKGYKGEYGHDKKE